MTEQEFIQISKECGLSPEIRHLDTLMAYYGPGVDDWLAMYDDCGKIGRVWLYGIKTLNCKKAETFKTRLLDRLQKFKEEQIRHKLAHLSQDFYDENR